MGIMVYSLLWVVQDFVHQPLLPTKRLKVYTFGGRMNSATKSRSQGLVGECKRTQPLLRNSGRCSSIMARSLNAKF